MARAQHALCHSELPFRAGSQSRTASCIFINARRRLQHLQNHQRKRPALGLVIQHFQRQLLVVGHGVQHGVQHPLGEQAVHYLFERVAIHLRHHVFLAADALGDAGEELQLVLVTDFGAKDIVQRVDDL